MQTEINIYRWLLNIHLSEFVERLRQIPPDQWEWQPTPPAPSARLVAEHALAWLQADRQHLQEPDVTRHPHTPPPPAEQEALCDALEAEAQQWQDLLSTLTAEQLRETRKQFGMRRWTVRQFIGHILQNTIYKHGQLATLYFALGLDGSEPYVAPLPNDYYAQLNAILARPLHAAAFRGERAQLEALLQSGADVNACDDHGVTVLMCAASQGHLEIIRTLLAHGADLHAQDHEGHTALQFAEMFGHTEATDLLRQSAASDDAHEL